MASIADSRLNCIAIVCTCGGTLETQKTLKKEMWQMGDGTIFWVLGFDLFGLLLSSVAGPSSFKTKIL